MDIYKINQLEAMCLADDAWSFVTPATHRNCWQKAGILPPSPDPTPSSDSNSRHPVMNIDNLLNPAQAAEHELNLELNHLIECGGLQWRY